MGEYKNENWVKNGKKWANIRMKNGTKFFDGKKVGKYKNFLESNFILVRLCLSQVYPFYTTFQNIISILTTSRKVPLMEFLVG